MTPLRSQSRHCNVDTGRTHLQCKICEKQGISEHQRGGTNTKTRSTRLHQNNGGLIFSDVIRTESRKNDKGDNTGWIGERYPFR